MPAVDKHQPNEPTSYKSFRRQQEALAKFGRFAFKSRSLDEILNEACCLIADALGTELATVMELQLDGVTLFVRAGVGWKPDVVGVITLGVDAQTSQGYALATGLPVISSDIATETRLIYPPFMIDNGVKAVANVNIIGSEGRRPFGVLQIGSRKPWQFTQDDIVFLQTYANLLAAAVDRLRVAVETQDSEERLSIALAASDLGSWDIDLVTKIATCTPRYERIFGYAVSPPHWSYDIFLNHVEIDDRDRVDTSFKNALISGAEWRVECRIRPADNDVVRWIEIRGGRVGDHRSGPFATHVLGIVSDITERIQVEERTRQSQRLEAVGRLTAGIAHDFNNVLQALLSNLELAIDEVQDRPNVRDNLELALRATQRGTRLTSHLLSFSRQQLLRPAAVMLKPLLIDLANTLSGTVGANISIRLVIAADLPDVFADDAHLDSALLNLALNACDAMHGEGEICIEALVKDGMIVISTIDTGEGMSAETLLRACEPFFTTKNLKGSGLGLAMAQGFAHQSGGELRIESVLGLGTKVEILLPVAPAAALPEFVDTAPLHSEGRLLLVDDNSEVRQTTAAILRKTGFDVVSVSSGQAALNELQVGAKFDLLITDYAMPEMNGAELIQNVRQIDSVMAVMLVTGFNSSESTEGLPAGTIVLTKPFKRSDLISSVRQSIMIVQRTEMITG